MLLETLRADWTARGANTRVSALPEFVNGALTLGAGTKLAEARADRRNEAAEGERAVTLVSVAIGRPLDASAATHVRRALAKAREGDAPLALTHLALAGVGRLTEPHDDAHRLFIADGLMKAGIPPRTIVEALGTPPMPDVLDRTYNSDQPRVPAGNGRPSGQWTSGEWTNVQAATTPAAAPPALGAQVADESSTRDREVRSDASSTSVAAPSPERPSALQSFLAGLLGWLPGTQYSAVAAQALHRGDYFNCILYEAAATLEAALVLLPVARASSAGAEAVSAEATAALQRLTLRERRAIQLEANKLAGQAWESTAQAGLGEAGIEALPQVTVKTTSGTRYITDFITRDPDTGQLGCAECKASATARFTLRQQVAIPEVSQSGATVVSPDIPGLPRGTKIPPSDVQILVGPKWPPPGWPPQR